MEAREKLSKPGGRQVVYGLPDSISSPPAKREYPEAGRGFEKLAGSTNSIKMITSQAKADSLRKPDVFEVADGVMELGIALAGLLGGVYRILS